MNRNYVPWHPVLSATIQTVDGWRVLSLACGHVEPWPAGTSTPEYTGCSECDPPTFHRRSWPRTWPVNVDAIAKAIGGAKSEEEQSR